jgi:MazG family protein
VFLSKLASETGSFTYGDVVGGIADKMIRRHPHVFGGAKAKDSSEVLVRWEEIKKSEKNKSGQPESAGSILAGIPPALPSLVKAQRLGAKAARVGFDWERDDDVLRKLDEETAELKAAVASGDRKSAQEEIGDTLFTLAMLARRLELDADAALAQANAKFERRFKSVEASLARMGVPIEGAGLPLMDRLWNEAKP